VTRLLELAIARRLDLGLPPGKHIYALQFQHNLDNRARAWIPPFFTFLERVPILPGRRPFPYSLKMGTTTETFRLSRAVRSLPRTILIFCEDGFDLRGHRATRYLVNQKINSLR
jgi:hypothetical protein